MACLANTFILHAPGVSHTVNPVTDSTQQITYKDIAIKVGRIRWNDGETLQVGFLGGDPWQQQTVAAVAVEWSRYANIHFNFSSQGPYDILISFDQTKGSWSLLGNQSRQNARANQASMNLGWVRTDLPAEIVSGTILHEFGHALGLAHQHQNRQRVSYNYNNFDRQACYAHYKQSDGWDQDMVDYQVFATFEVDESQVGRTGVEQFFTHHLVMPSYDIYSIMMYPFPPNLTQGGLGGTGLNTKLSEGDKLAIHQAYPATPNIYMPNAPPSQPGRPNISELNDNWNQNYNSDWWNVRREDGTWTTVGELKQEQGTS